MIILLFLKRVSKGRDNLIHIGNETGQMNVQLRFFFVLDNLHIKLSLFGGRSHHSLPDVLGILINLMYPKVSVE